MGRLFRFVVSGASVAELKNNMSRALDELNGEETTAIPAAQPAAQQVVTPPPPSIAIQIGTEAHRSIPAPQAVNPVSGIDSMGLPWDERIHSSNMGRNKDGSWRIKRGVEPAYVKQIEHELIDKIKNGGAADAPTFPPPVQQVATNPIPTFPPAPSPVTALPPLQPVAPVAPLGNVPPPLLPLTVLAAAVAPPMVPPIVQPIATPVAPQLPKAVTSAHSLQTFTEQFVPTLSFLVAEGKLTNEYVAALKTYFKLEQIYDANAQQISEMFETFCQAGLLTKVG